MCLLPGPQRWNPVGGFCEKLLPSDRWQWSDVSGLQHRPLDGVALPSPHWVWESDWYVDENFGGEPTEKGVGAFHSCRGSPVGKDPVPPGAVPGAPASTLSWCPACSCSGYEGLGTRGPTTVPFPLFYPAPPSPIPSCFLPSPGA